MEYLEGDEVYDRLFDLFHAIHDAAGACGEFLCLSHRTLEGNEDPSLLGGDLRGGEVLDEGGLDLGGQG